MIPEGVTMPCDVVILTGSAVLNEAILTGEATPVIKQDILDSNDQAAGCPSKHIIFGGTSAIQTRGDVTGLVTKTGFLTTKGSLVRDILYPKPIKFSFYTDAIKFIAVMFIVALAGSIYILPIMIENEADTETLVDRVLNMVVIAVPPALPAAMGAGVAFAIRRLKRQKIFCISPPRVNLAGNITTFVFDKTGTLTEEGLSVHGFRASEKSAFSDFTESVSGYSRFIEALACCTSITFVKDKLIGDPLDVEMFKSTGWKMTEP